jgi:hypothetical protein
MFLNVVLPVNAATKIMEDVARGVEELKVVNRNLVDISLIAAERSSAIETTIEVMFALQKRTVCSFLSQAFRRVMDILVARASLDPVLRNGGTSRSGSHRF